MKKTADSGLVTAVTIILMSLAVIVPVGLYLTGLQSKSLSFSVLARSPLVDVSLHRLADLEVSYRGEKVQKVESLTLQFENSGNVPINAQDFEKPMEVVFEKDSHILSAEVANASPSNLKPTVSLSVASIAIAPLLLNANDRFALTIVVSGSVGTPRPNARISGIGEITTLADQDSKQLGRILAVAAWGVIVMTLVPYMFGLAWFGRSRSLIVPWYEVLFATLLVTNLAI